MAILRWAIIAALAMAFLLLSVANWTPVPFRLPDGAIISLPLPVLMGGAFIAGWLPTWLWHLGVRATLNRRLGRVMKVETSPPAAPSPAMTSLSQPTIVPPAGA